MNVKERTLCCAGVGDPKVLVTSYIIDDTKDDDDNLGLGIVRDSGC